NANTPACWSRGTSKMARNRALILLQALCYGALKPCCASQYSPRPPESAQKKTPDLKPDQIASLSRHRLVPRHTESKLNQLSIDCFKAAEREFFCFFLPWFSSCYQQ